MESKVSLPYSQMPATEYCPKPDQCNSHSHAYIFMILSCIDVTIEEFWTGWLDLFHHIHSRNSELQTIQRYEWSTHITVHRYTRTDVLSLY
jgi:hypothetical protein